MDQSKCHRIDQKPHRIIQWRKPQWLDGNRLPKERTGHHVHHVSKISSKQDAPDYRRDAAEHKHLD